MHRAADAAPLALSLSAHVFPNFLVVRSGRFFLADSAVDMTRALCAPALAAANWLVTNQLVRTTPLTGAGPLILCDQVPAIPPP